MQNRIFSVDSPKAVKAKDYGYLNAIHYMAPHRLAMVGDLCGNASPGCIALCLGQHSGAATYYPSVLRSRIAKAKRFMKERAAYLADMHRAIMAVVRKALGLGFTPCVRLNGATDLAWEHFKHDGKSLFDWFPNVQFVDYTKSLKRMLAWLAGKLPSNYHLTFSRSETNEADCRRVLALGGTVAVVFANGAPANYLGHPTIDGDKHDLRHLDPNGVVVGLSPKGNAARRDKSGFVVR
jgi:hypothetical protein